MTATLQIASAEGVPGAACTVVRDRDGGRLVLSNHHVVFGGGAMPGDRVWARDDEGALVHLGHALRGHLGRVTYRGETHFVDCAVVGLREPSRLPRWVTDALDRLPRRAASVRTGDAVAKFGPATGRTDGVVAATEHFDAPYIDGRGYQAPRQMLIESSDPALRFCSQGDSGAAVLDEHGQVVGLLWGIAGTDKGIACPIGAVLDVLEIALDGGDR